MAVVLQKGQNLPHNFSIYHYSRKMEMNQVIRTAGSVNDRFAASRR